MRILCTGGAGFLGSHVIETLFDSGNSILSLDDYSTGKIENVQELSHRANLGADKSKPDAWLRNGDVRRRYDVRDAMEFFKPDAVVHLAAQAAISTSIENPITDLEINGRGTITVVQAALDYGVKRFVFASTSAVYKHVDYSPIIHDEIALRENHITGPDTPYGISKLAAEGYVRTLFPDSCILRFGNILGPRQVPIGENQVLSRMIRHFKYGDKFYIHGSGNQKRDFIYVSDVVSAVIAALDGEPGTYNVASGEAHSVDEMAQIVELAYGVPGYKWDHTEQEDPRAYVCLDITSAKQGLGWEPKVKFEQAVKQTIDWWETL